MATSEESRLAPATARDGVDTRKKDNWGSAAAVNQETTRSGAGDRAQDGSNAALEFDAWLATLPHVRLDLAVPAGAEVEGAPIWGAWGAYEQIAVRHIEDSEESFRWVSYETQRERAEEALVAAVSEENQMDMVLLNNLNREVVALAYAIARARRQLRASPFLVDYYKTVVLSRVGDVEDAEAELAAVLQEDEGWWNANADVDYEDYRNYTDNRWVGPPPPIRIPAYDEDEPDVWTPRVY